MRTIIDIPEEQLVPLDYLCSEASISRAEAVRRALRDYLDKHPSLPEDAAFGLWKNRKEDALGYQHELRKEWGA